MGLELKGADGACEGQVWGLQEGHICLNFSQVMKKYDMGYMKVVDI